MAEEPPKPGEEPGAAPAPEGEQPPVPAEGEQPPVPPEGEQPAVPPEGEQPPPGEQPAQPAPEAPAPDGQHSWMVAAAVAWNVFCSSLLRRALPVMFYAVGDAFSVEAKGSVAWMNAFIYSLAYTLTPVVAVMCRTTPLRTLSVAGSALVGVGQIACFVLGSVYLMVPVVALFCGLAAAVSMAVAETALHLHFVSERHKAMSLYHGAFSLSAIVYPAVLVGLVETYGLNGALLVSGAISLNALAGSMLINRPVWMSATDPLPAIHGPTDAETAGAAAQPAPGGEGEPKPDGKPKPEGEHKELSMSMAQPEDAGALSGVASVATTGDPSGATSGLTSGAVSVDPGTAVASQAATAPAEGGEQPPPAEGNAEQQPGAPGGEKAPSPTAAAPGPAEGTTVGTVLAVHSALTSLSVTASVLIYDYALDGDPERGASATVSLVSFGLGDLAGRVGYDVLLTSGEHRKVMAVQAFLMGGVLFLMALAKEVFLLAPAGFALGWLTSSLDMLPEPLLLRFCEPGTLERQLQVCRGASGIACLVGPVIVMVFPDTYSVMFIVAGLASLLAGAVWLPGIQKEMAEAAAKNAPPKLAGEPGAETALGEAGEGGAVAGELGAAGEPGVAPVEGAEPGTAEPGAPAAGELAAADPAAAAPSAPA